MKRLLTPLAQLGVAAAHRQVRATLRPDTRAQIERMGLLEVQLAAGEATGALSDRWRKFAARGRRPAARRRRPRVKCWLERRGGGGGGSTAGIERGRNEYHCNAPRGKR
jgi:hypothetical protein